MITEMTMRSAYDDLDISVLTVAPEQEPKAVLQISHGTFCAIHGIYGPSWSVVCGS